jgi:membrane protease YdiL (CAAX protease family)
VVLGAAGFLYARGRGIGFAAALPVIAAFLITYPFYLAMGFREVRDTFGDRRLPVVLMALSALPYLACCAGAIPFQWLSLARLMALGLAAGLWFDVLPVSAVTDLAFLALVPAVILGGVFDSIYPPYLGQKLVTLGHVTFIPMAILPLMLERRVPETGFSFAPARREWRIGVLNFLYFLPVGGGLGFVLGAFKPHAMAAPWKIAGTFVAFLWVTALSEEFLFRGVLQPWIANWTGNRAAGLVITSAIFGAMHVGFPGFPFPNWRWVLLAGVLGWFCGRARDKAESIGASTVTHTLAVTALRAFLG